ncbi:MAG: amidohydrolase family protein, partial [Candidatus Bathyarchaeota archaeon]|nr:amidohydrolase family protein [Candidatus Bathyarchaeota archaeon]
MPELLGCDNADLLLLNGRIVTVDPDFSIVEAVAVGDGKIIAVGSSDEVARWRGEGTEVVDLGGKVVLPGLIDSHLHMLGTGLAMAQINCRTPPMRSIADIVKAVEEAVARAKPGDWIQGRGWDQAKLSDHRSPTRWDLDVISPENPVWLTRTCGHVAVVNSAALEVGGVTKGTLQPVGGNIVKDEQGEPTGLLEEAPAMDLVRKYVPPPSFEETCRAIGLASKAFSEAGLTGVIEAGVGPMAMMAYQEMASEGHLTVRVNMMLSGRMEG